MLAEIVLTIHPTLSDFGKYYCTHLQIDELRLVEGALETSQRYTPLLLMQLSGLNI